MALTSSLFEWAEQGKGTPGHSPADREPGPGIDGLSQGGKGLAGVAGEQVLRGSPGPRMASDEGNAVSPQMGAPGCAVTESSGMGARGDARPSMGRCEPGPGPGTRLALPVGAMERPERPVAPINLTVREIYTGSNGEATSALYGILQGMGLAGLVALNLFRACKCSERAKLYRRGAHKREAYERKNYSIQN